MSYCVVHVSFVSVSSVVSPVSPKDWKSECGLGTTATASDEWCLIGEGTTLMLRSTYVSACAWRECSTHTVTLNDCAFLSIQWLELVNWTRPECGSDAFIQVHDLDVVRFCRFLTFVTAVILYNQRPNYSYNEQTNG